MEKSILVLEDEKYVAKSYEKNLIKNGYHPIIAYDGFQGLEKLKETKPDLILLDLMMPRMNGLEFYQYICGSDGLPRYPVLMLTARLDLMEVFKDFYVDGILVKPFEMSRLLSEIETIFYVQSSRENNNHVPRIVIIDEDPFSSKRIANAFSRGGYISEIAPSGKEGIDIITSHPPDLAVISLGLTDISGDMVVLKLQQVIKTRNTKYILYAPNNHEHDKIIMQKFAEKTGIKLVCEYSNPMELLEIVNKMLQS